MNQLLHARHAIPWVAAAAAAAPGLAITLTGFAFHRQSWAASLVVTGMLLLALPAAYILDDPSQSVAGATPRNPWWDLSGRLLALWALCGLMIAGTWVWHRLAPTPQPWLVALIPICLAVLAVAGSAALRRAGRSSPGDAVAGGLAFLIMGLSLFRPTVRTWELMPSAGSADVAEAALWLSVATLALLVIGWSPCSRGPRTAVDA
jgi:hypothetical protein